jgi:hypothetical protein
LIEGLAKEVGAEWRLRRDAPNTRYLIDVVDTVSGVIADIEAREGLNILSLVRQRNRERLFTSIRPSGALPTGSEERANIGWNAWKVTAVSGDDVTVVPHGGGIGAILEDGQHVGLYLEAADGTFHEIEGSVESTQTFELESGAGASFAVNNDVAIVADDQGTLLTSLDSPSGIAASGYVQGTVNSRNLGHRNWVRNPASSEYTNPPFFGGLQFDGTQTGTTINFKSFDPNRSVAVGDLIMTAGGVQHSITAPATADGSGNITIELAPTISGGNNVWAYVFEQTSSAADHWFGFGGLKIERGPEVNQTANLDGAASSSARVALKNLPPNFVIPAGTRIGNWVIQDTVADGSGNATVEVFPPISGADNAAVTLRRPEVPGMGSLVGCPVFRSGQSIRQDVRIRSGGGPVVLSASFWGWSQGTGTASDWPGDNLQNGRVRILTTGNALIAQSGLFEIEWTAADTLQGARQSVVAHGLATGTYRFVVDPPQVPSAVGITFWALRSVQVSLGTEPQPFVEGSAATRLFQDGQLALLASRQWPATYTARLSEIVSEWGLPANSPSLALGSFLRVRSPSTGIDALLRIVAIEYDPTDPSDRIFTLDSDPERISTLSSRSRPRPVFVDVNVEVVDDRARQTVLVSEAPPVAAPGAERFVVPEGTTAPVVNTPLVVQPLDSSIFGG